MRNAASGMRGSLAAGGEKGLHCGGAFGGENAGGNFDAMVQRGMIEYLEAGAHGAAFGIVGAVHQARDTGLDHRSGAHGAGFDGDVERGAEQAIISDGARGGAQRHDFSVRGGILIGDGAIGGLGYDAAIDHDNCPDGDFSDGGRGARLVKREAHEIGVGWERVHAGESTRA
jgi:hypothetical protein